jgi:hypothetical protein
MQAKLKLQSVKQESSGQGLLTELKAAEKEKSVPLSQKAPPVPVLQLVSLVSPFSELYGNKSKALRVTSSAHASKLRMQPKSLLVLTRQTYQK